MPYSPEVVAPNNEWLDLETPYLLGLFTSPISRGGGTGDGSLNYRKESVVRMQSPVYHLQHTYLRFMEVKLTCLNGSE